MAGTCTINAETGILTIEGAPPGEENLNLTQCKDSPTLLEKISLMARKPWMTNELLGAIVRKIQIDLVPEVNYCPGGREAPVKAPHQVIQILAKTQ